MKKIKINLLLFAVIAAVVSSYTTAPKSDSNWFFLQLPTTISTFSTLGVFNNLSTYTSATSVAPVSIETAAAACPSTNPEYLVCAVKITDYNENVTTQLDAQDLDALVDPFVYTDIVGFKYFQD